MNKKQGLAFLFRLLPRSLQRGRLIITYKKIPSLPKIEAGYIDIKTVAKRYSQAIQNFTFNSLLKEQSVKDNLYFLEEECQEFWQKRSRWKRMLDVGCGNGLYAYVFSRPDSPFSKLSYYGLEVSDELVSVCKKAFPRGNFFCSLAHQINMPDSFFDFTFCSSTLHYTLDKWREAIKEMARVSKSFLAITRFPVTKYNNSFYVHQRVQSISGTENHYFIVINRREVEDYFAKVGLVIRKRDYSLEEYNIENVNEKIILVQYLLEK